MRRPLFTTGIPQLPPSLASIVDTPNDALSVLDLRSVGTTLQSVTRLVTLYAVNQDVASQQIVDVAWREGAGTPVLVASVTLPEGELLEAPTKVLDRFPLRGNAQLLACTADGATPIVFGYFELENSKDSEQRSRPLQPGALVSPYGYAPVIVDSPDPAAAVHTLDTNYVDQVTLVVRATGGGGGGTATGFVTVDDGSDSITINIEDNAGANADNTLLFDGIPMIAAAAGGAISIGAGVGVSDSCSAYGSFIRIA